MKTSLHLSLAIICIILILCVGATSGLGGLLVNILAAAIVVLLEYIILTKERLLILSKTLFKKDRIRLSLSYLIRIRINGKYLLVKGNRIKGQFQPVGGVYKKLPAATHELERLGVRKDEAMAGDLEDLRINVSAPLVLKVVDWFNQNKQRESTPIREFVEELIEDNVISPSDHHLFRWALFTYVRQHRTGIRFSHHLQMRELLISDIYELAPTTDQEAALLRILDSDNARWVTAEDIKRQGHTPGGETEIKISNNAEWLLPVAED